MAILADDNKLLDQNQDQQQQQNQAVGGGGQSPLVGGNSSAVSTGVGTAGVGAGGTGKWTNIQAYLNANKSSDTGATQLLQDSAGKQFDKERTTIDDQSKAATKQASDALNPVKEANTNKESWLTNAATNYSWDNPASNNQYNDYVNKFKGALGAQYSGPKTFDYTMGADTQNYGASLGNDDAFNKYLGDLYQNKAGGQLSGGQRALQTQLNISNEPLAQMRQSLLKKYADLGDYRNKVVSDTGSLLKNAEQDLRTNQNSLRDWFKGQQNAAESAQGQKESQAKYDYNTEYNNGKSGRAGWALQTLQATRGDGIDYGIGAAERYLANQGLLGNDLTWNQLQKEQDIGDNLSGTWGSLRQRDDWRGTANTAPLTANRDALTNWYTSQDTKYANTGDEEKRRFNSIADILGAGTKKSQGFKVRG